ncbi:MAG: ABC transporter permease [Gordonia sp.]|nr:ABC transporter permease [Gordonia sp. (in: high G+C Gram-positive bacteria)]
MLSDIAAGAGQIWRGVRAEAVRSGGLRGVLLLAAFPAGVLVPLLVTFAIAFAFERIANFDTTDITVTETTTTNSVYWVMYFTVAVGTITAAFAQASAMRGPGRDLDRYLYPRTWTSPLGRWIYYGLLTAVASLVLITVIMATLGPLFPTVYSQVDLTSDAGVRFLITVPILSFFACGMGVGVAAVIGSPAASIAFLLLWIFLIEEAIYLVPNGMKIQAYMPFLNGIWSTGQEIVIDPTWGKDGALIYFGLVSIGVFLIGMAVLALRRRN